MPKLLLKFNMAVIKEIPIPEGTVVLTLGRKEDNDIIIDNPAVSGHHARIVRQGDKFFIEDLNSTNGTFIEGKKILKAELSPGLSVDVAKHSIVFIDDAGTSAAAAPAAPMATDKTFVMDPARQKAMMDELKAAQEKASRQVETVGCLRITDGVVDKTEVELTGLNTYIGNSESSAVRIVQAKGLFGLGGSVEGNVALINRRPEGIYILKATRQDYVRLNTKTVKEEDLTALSEGDLIEAGKTKMVFFMKMKS